MGLEGLEVGGLEVGGLEVGGLEVEIESEGTSEGLGTDITADCPFPVPSSSPLSTKSIYIASNDFPPLPACCISSKRVLFLNTSSQGLINSIVCSISPSASSNSLFIIASFLIPKALASPLANLMLAIPLSISLSKALFLSLRKFTVLRALAITIGSGFSPAASASLAQLVSVSLLTVVTVSIQAENVSLAAAQTVFKSAEITLLSAAESESVAVSGSAGIAAPPVEATAAE
ncbi:hypothetical protein XENTR_v10010647 [Xenopus tropicalis]|nr:hypothetical protein XENTR_v10010647 [Xenopus tropicalis]